MTEEFFPETKKAINKAIELQNIRNRLEEISLEMDQLIDLQRSLVKETNRLLERAKALNDE
jgi:hypothetical protein